MNAEKFYCGKLKLSVWYTVPDNTVSEQIRKALFFIVRMLGPGALPEYKIIIKIIISRNLNFISRSNNGAGRGRLEPAVETHSYNTAQYETQYKRYQYIIQQEVSKAKSRS